MIKETYIRKLIKAIIDLTFIAEHDRNLKEDNDYNERRLKILEEVNRLNVYDVLDLLDKLKALE